MKKVRNVIGGIGNLMFKNAYLYAQARDGNIPDLYLQSPRYFKGYEQEIKALYGEGIGKIDKVALHIRRGDYSNNSFYVNLWETDYYKKAVAMFPGERFLVFCADRQDFTKDGEDRKWCMENLSALLGENWELAPYGKDETDDLNLMASCKSVIMANSSFSWWGAWLGDHEKVVCPSQWHPDGITRTEPAASWILI